MWRCVECGCVSAEARAWLACLIRDPDGTAPPEVARYCPPCYQREFGPPAALDTFY